MDFTKLGMCTDILEIRFGISNRQILLIFYNSHDFGRVFCFTFSFLFFHET